MSSYATRSKEIADHVLIVGSMAFDDLEFAEPTWDASTGTRKRSFVDVVGGMVEEKIRQYGLGSRFAGVHVLGLSFADIADDARWNAALDDAAEHFAGSGVTAILNGCSAVEVRVGSGVPVFDPTRAALTLLGAAHASRLVPLGGGVR